MASRGGSLPSGVASSPVASAPLLREAHFLPGHRLLAWHYRSLPAFSGKPLTWGGSFVPIWLERLADGQLYAPAPFLSNHPCPVDYIPALAVYRDTRWKSSKNTFCAYSAPLALLA